MDAGQATGKRKSGISSVAKSDPQSAPSGTRQLDVPPAIYRCEEHEFEIEMVDGGALRGNTGTNRVMDCSSCEAVVTDAFRESRKQWR